MPSPKLKALKLRQPAQQQAPSPGAVDAALAALIDERVAEALERHQNSQRERQVAQYKIQQLAPRPAPRPDDVLAVPVARLVDDAVASRLAQTPAPDASTIRRLVDDRLAAALQQLKQGPGPEWLAQAPAPVTHAPAAQAPPHVTLQLKRDELGRVAVVNVGQLQYRVQRGVEGEIVALVPSDDAAAVLDDGGHPVLPAPLNR
ncbi:MAG: hypothetical protein ACI9UK_000676 [Candidatus Krumholzibacteriia bacterium]|jgi:hypothetical protein